MLVFRAKLKAYAGRIWPVLNGFHYRRPSFFADFLSANSHILKIGQKGPLSSQKWIFLS